ncbi:MAG: oligopeptide transporter permease OppB [Caulobacteraceae bacterium]|nr:oligopeptide transporter permease OppB [Caulobacteraceae bacterium]
MLSFIFRRLVVAIPTLFLVITLAFFMMRAAPGSPFDSNQRMTPEVRANLEAKYGFDQPLHVQYARYIGGVVRGDFGPSLKYKTKSVADFIKEGFPTSLLIGGSALLFASLIGLSLGIWAALRQNRVGDYLATGVAILGVCIPTFVTAPLLILFFASKLGWLPNGGVTAGLKSYILPITVLALPQIAIISRLTRAGMIEVLRSNYVRTARAKGLPEHTVVFRHAIRAALIPLVSYLGPAAAGLITGSLVVEKLFGLPGLGKSFILGALQRDYTVVMGVVILYAALILLLNLLADVVVALLDPRVRLS